MIVNSNKENNKTKLAIELATRFLKQQEFPVILCIGSDKVLGDLMGVIVGEKLKREGLENAYIYGDVENCINYNNIDKVLKSIKEKHPFSPIIVIDSMLGEEEEIGCVKTYSRGAYVGGGFNKGRYIGDYSILGVVSTKGISALKFLSSVKLKHILQLAEFITEAIVKANKLCLSLNLCALTS